MTATMLPLQPVVRDGHGTLRFRANVLVEHLLDHGGLSMNDLARAEAPQADREQFAQLIGYSLSGFGELSYVREETYALAEALAQSSGTADPKDAYIAALEAQLAQLQGVVARIAAMAADPTHVALEPDGG